MNASCAVHVRKRLRALLIFEITHPRPSMAFDHGQAGTKAWGNMLASAHKFDPILYVAGIVEEHWVVMLVAVFGFFLVIINPYY